MHPRVHCVAAGAFVQVEHEHALRLVEPWLTYSSSMPRPTFLPRSRDKRHPHQPPPHRREFPRSSRGNPPGPAAPVPGARAPNTSPCARPAGIALPMLPSAPSSALLKPSYTSSTLLRLSSGATTRAGRFRRAPSPDRARAPGPRSPYIRVPMRTCPRRTKYSALATSPCLKIVWPGRDPHERNPGPQIRDDFLERRRRRAP